MKNQPGAGGSSSDPPTLGALAVPQLRFSGSLLVGNSSTWLAPGRQLVLINHRCTNSSLDQALIVGDSTTVDGRCPVTVRAHHGPPSVDLF